MILALLTAVLVQPASAQPQDSASVLSGQDIVAWRALPQDDPQALRGFIQDYPSSPLSERAFTRLQELGDHQAVLSVPAQRGLAASADAHYRALVRPSGIVAVATMDLSAPESSSGLRMPSFSPRLELGAASLGQTRALNLGVGLQSRTLGAVARARLGQQRYELQLGARIELPTTSAWTPYGEWLGAYRLAQQSAAWSQDGSPWATGLALGMGRTLRQDLSAQAALEYWPTRSALGTTGLGLTAALRYSF